MQNLHIVVADGIKGPGIDLLIQAFGKEAIEVRGAFKEEELCQKIKDMDALLIRSATTVTAKAIEAAGPRLKLIGRAGVGTDNIDKEAATKKGIVVMNTPFGNTVSAAEHTIALLFATARNIARADALMQQGKWEKKGLVGVEVHGKTLGLIGLGKIGGHVAQVMKAAGMTIVAYDPYLSPDRARHLGVQMVDLDELIAKSDFISVHTPLTDETRNLLSRERLQKTKKGVRILNCARGGIIDEEALADLVKAGHIAAAGIDVFSKEPMTSGPLFGVKDITLTPHLGASTEEAEDRCGIQIAEQTIAFFKEGVILNAVNIDIAADKELRGYVEVAKAAGTIAATLLNAPVEKIEVACAGTLLGQKDTSEITAAAVLGVLRRFSPEDVNIINALYLAKQRNIAVSETRSTAESGYTNVVEVTVSGGGKVTRIAGTAFDHQRPRILRIDDAEMEIKLDKHMLFLRYPDRPGYVGKFGTIIAKHGINIANMAVGCLESRKRASMAIGLNSPVSEEVLEELRQVEGVERAYYVAL